MCSAVVKQCWHETTAQVVTLSHTFSYAIFLLPYNQATNQASTQTTKGRIRVNCLSRFCLVFRLSGNCRNNVYYTYVVNIHTVLKGNESWVDLGIEI